MATLTGASAASAPLPASGAAGSITFLALSQKQRIQRALLQVSNLAGFHPVSTDVSTGEISVDTTVNIVPGSFALNEVSSVFGPARLNRREPELRERLSWVWKLKMAFDQEADSEKAENILRQGPRFLLLNAQQDKLLRQVTLLLLDSTYEHPQASQAARGSVISFTFEASVPPR